MKHSIYKELLWGYFAQALNIGAGILLLPLVLRYMPAIEVSIWFVFLTLGSLAQLLEFGFNPTISRNTSYIYAGAESLLKTGLSAATDNTSINSNLLAELILASKIIYKYVSIACLILMLLFGSIYVGIQVDSYINKNEIIFGWILFSLGYVINFYFGYANAIIQGRGDIIYYNKLMVVSRLIFVFFGIFAITNGLGIGGLGFSMLMSSLVGRVLALYYLKQEKISSFKNIYNKNNSTYSKRLMPILWHNASRFGLVQIGGFLIQRSTILVGVTYLGLEESASYSMTITIMIALSSISNVISQVQMTKISKLQITGSVQKIKLLYSRILISSILIFISGDILLILYGDDIMKNIGSSVKLLPFELLLTLSLMALLELNHSIAASYLTTKNSIPFVSASIYSGIAIIFFSIVLITPYGVWGLIVSQALVQLSYNNWKWPLEVNAALQINGLRIYSYGFKRDKGE